MEVQPKPLVPGSDLETQWKIFKWRLLCYIELDVSRCRWNAEKKASALVLLIGHECAYLHEDAEEDVKKDVALLIMHIDNKVKPETKSCLARFMFKQYRREPNEDLDLFVSKCTSKLAHCSIHNADIDVFIIDSLVQNLKCKRVYS